MKFLFKTCVMLLAMITSALAADPPRSRPVVGVKTTNPTTYQITMTTTLVIPDGNTRVDQIRVYHALPTVRPWNAVRTKYGATNVDASPRSAKLEVHQPTDASYLIWTLNPAQKPGTKLSFASTMTVVSPDRDLDPAAVKVTWKQYAGPQQDKSAVVDATVARSVHPELAQVATKLKAELAPAEAVQAMCKWILENIKYDASVAYPTTDVESIVRKKCGHCGHQAKVLEQMTASVGIPIRTVWGLNLYAADGKTSDLQVIRSDFTNIHTWAEVYFPTLGWVEVDPGLGAKAYALPAQQIQNNRWFQNYSIWLRENGLDKQPAWILDGDKFRSDYAVEHVISYVKKK